MIVNYYPTEVKSVTKPPTFTEAERSALEDAGVSHVNVYGNTHLFSRECDAPGCTECYVFRITEDDKLFPGIVAHMTQPYALYCKSHQPNKLTGASLIAYAPKSSGGGNGGSSKGGRKATGRTRRNSKGYNAEQIKAFEAELAEVCDWLAAVGAGMVEATPSMKASAEASRDSLTATIEAYRAWKAVAA